MPTKNNLQHIFVQDKWNLSPGFALLNFPGNIMVYKTITFNIRQAHVPDTGPKID